MNVVTKVSVPIARRTIMLWIILVGGLVGGLVFVDPRICWMPVLIIPIPFIRRLIGPESDIWFGTTLAFVMLEFASIFLAWRFHAGALNGPPAWTVVVLTATWMVVGMIHGAHGWRRYLDCKGIPHTEAFHRHLVFLGVVLVIGGIITSTIYGGVVSRNGGPDAVLIKTSTILLISVGNAILGSVFFIISRCRELRNSKTRFQPDRFWGGCWFRIGEAVLFTLVLFFLIWVSEGNTGVTEFKGLPLLALMLGMFVKPGERLMEGIRSRLFATIEALVFGLTSSSGDKRALSKGTVRQPSRGPSDQA